MNFDLPGGLRVTDLLDILVVSFVIYRVLLIIKGTRAMGVLGGLIVLVALYALSILLELSTVNWVLEEFSFYLVLAVIVLFQDDIRRGLARVGDPLLAGRSRKEKLSVYQQVASACFRLADQGKGALICVEREASLEELGEGATDIDAVITEPLLVAIFQTTSPIHDGSVVIRKDRIWVAGTFLPLSTRPDIPPSLGTRHRAAIGQTERTDSMVFIVSEERRTVSISFGGELYPVDSPDELRLKVQELVSMEQQKEEEQPPANALGLTGSFAPARLTTSGSHSATQTTAGDSTKDRTT